MSRPSKSPDEDVLILSQPGKSAEFAKAARPAGPGAINPVFLGVSDLSTAAPASPAVPVEAKAAAPVETKQPSAEPANLTWAQAAGRPEASVHLACLPEGLSLGDDFPEPLRYDADRQLLIYRGFMTSMSCQYLRSLSTDLVFLSALDELNVRTSTILIGGPEQRHHPWRRAIVATAIMAVVAAALFAWHLLRVRAQL